MQISHLEYLQCLVNIWLHLINKRRCNHKLNATVSSTSAIVILSLEWNFGNHIHYEVLLTLMPNTFQNISMRT